MKKQFALLAIVFLGLAGYAIYLAQRAFHRGELTIFVVMMFAAVIFWRRLQKSS